MNSIMPKLILIAILTLTLVVGYRYTHQQAPLFSAYSPSGGGTYRLLSSVGSSDTTVTLASFKEPVSNIRYTMSYLNSTIEFGTLEPQTNTKEFISFTGITQNSDGSATLTGVLRGLGFSYPYTASTTLQQSHPGQSIFILSNPPQLTNQYANKNNSETINPCGSTCGTWTFASTSPPVYDVNPTFSNALQLIDKQYADSLTINGAPTSTETAMGVSVLTPQTVIGSSTASTTGSGPYVIQNKFATTTPGTQCTSGTWVCIPAGFFGKLPMTWLNLALSWIFTGPVTIPATSSNKLTLNSVPYVAPSFQGASSTALYTDASGVQTWILPDWTLVSATTSAITQAMISATTTASTAYPRLKIIVEVTGETANSGGLQMRFNNDASALGYGSKNRENSTLNGDVQGASLNLDSGTTSARYYVFDVQNTATANKLVTWTGGKYDTGPAVPVMVQGAGNWNNTSSAITTVNVLGISTDKINAGSRIFIYGAQ